MDSDDANSLSSTDLSTALDSELADGLRIEIASSTTSTPSNADKVHTPESDQPITTASVSDSADSSRTKHGGASGQGTPVSSLRTSAVLSSNKTASLGSKTPRSGIASASPRSIDANESNAEIAQRAAMYLAQSSQHATSQFEKAQQKMIAQTTSTADLYKIITSLRERIEIVHTQEYSNFLKYLFPAFKAILLSRVQPQVSRSNYDAKKDKIRNGVLDILTRLPMNNVWMQYADKIMDLAMIVLIKDNESNALVCIKIIFELHKSHKNHNKHHVLEFIKYVQKLYSNLPGTLKHSFDRAKSRQTENDCVPSMYSFPVLTECPLVVMLLFQVHPKDIKAHIADLIPRMMNTIVMKIPAITSQTLQRSYQDRVLEMVACQVKTLQFLTYLLKPFSNALRSQAKPLAEAVVYLFKMCPSEAVAVRKELFVATRHILATDFRAGFYPFVNELLKERVVLGSGRMANATLRPLAYSTVADLVHHVRNRLKLKQISSIIYIFSRNIEDPMLPLSIQITSVRLLLNLVDNIYHNKETDHMKGWNLLVRILTTLVNKFCSLQQDIAHIVADESARAERAAKHAREFSGRLLEVIKDEEENPQQPLPAALGPVSLAAATSKPIAPVVTSGTGAVAPKVGAISEPTQEGEAMDVDKPKPSSVLNLPMSPPPARVKSPMVISASGSSAEPAVQAAVEAGGKTSTGALGNATEVSALVAPTSGVGGVRVARPTVARSSGDPVASLDSGKKGETIKGMKALIKTMVLGLKTVVWCVSNYRTSSSGGGPRGSQTGAAVPLTEYEIELIANFFEYALGCLDVYGAGSDDEKDVLEHFANVFTVLNLANFRDIFQRSSTPFGKVSAMELLYQYLLKRTNILTIPQVFLQTSRVSSTFADILLDFLLDPKRIFYLSASTQSKCSTFDRVEDVESKFMGLDSCIDGSVYKRQNMATNSDSGTTFEDERASVLLKLHKLVFGSVSIHKDNESVLLPKLNKIITQNLRYAAEVKDPRMHLELLRSLFRSIGGGKYETLYKELLELLPGLLTGLVQMQRTTVDPVSKRLLIELCLTVPARLPSLLKHLPLLMTPVILALKSVHAELITLALRTLEFWIDNLNREYLYPIVSQKSILLGLMAALTDLLKPKPALYGNTAMRILGKMGGQNRLYLTKPLEFQLDEDADTGMVVEFEWGTSEERSPPGSLKMDKFVNFSVGFLNKHFESKASPAQPSSSSTVVKSKETAVTTESNDVESKVPDDTIMLETDASRKPEKVIVFPPKRSIASIIATGLSEKNKKRVKHEHKLSQQAEASAKAVVKYHEESQKSGKKTTLTPGAVKLHYKRMALQLITSSLALYFEKGSEPHDARVYELRGGESPGSFDEDHGTHERQQSPPAHIDGSQSTPIMRNQLRACERVLKSMLVGLLTASADAKMCGEAWPIMKGFARHLFLLCVSSHGDGQSSTHAEPSVLCEVLLEGWSSSKEDIVNASTAVFGVVLNDAVVLSGGDADLIPTIGMQMWKELLKILSHGCFERQWQRNVGACTGIHVMISSMPNAWVQQNELVIVKALLFCLHDHTYEYQAHVIAAAQKSLNLLLTRRTMEVIEYPEDADESRPMMALQAKDPSLYKIIHLLSMELTRKTAASRNVAQINLALVAKTNGLSLRSLLVPFAPFLHKYIFDHSLASVMHEEQIARISCAMFVLSLDGKSPLFPVEKEVVAFLMQAVELTSSQKLEPQMIPIHLDAAGFAVAEKKTRKILGLQGNPKDMVEDLNYPFGGKHETRLRVFTLGFIHAFLKAAPMLLFDEAVHANRNAIIALCCKSLTAVSPDIIGAAKTTLSLLMAKMEKSLPTELLKKALRPVLAHLAKFDNMTPALIDVLAHVLELLHTCFTDALGKQLLLHLAEWTKPEQIILTDHWLEPGREPEVAQKTIALFQYLPSSETFIEPLVKITLDLEKTLHKYRGQRRDSRDRSKTLDVSGCGYSPYRLPLVAFLNKHPEKSISFFLNKERLVDRTYAKLFQSMIKLPEAKPLRDKLMEDGTAEMLVNQLFLLEIEETDEKCGNGDGMLTKSIAPELPYPSPEDLFLVRQELEKAQFELQKARRNYQTLYAKQRKYVADCQKQLQEFTTKYQTAKDKIDTYSGKSYSQKLKDTALKRVKTAQRELENAKLELKEKVMKQYEATAQAEEKVEICEKFFEEQQVLFGKVQRRLPVFKCTSAQADAEVSMALPKSPAGQVLALSPAEARVKAEYWAKMWANSHLKGARDCISKKSRRPDSSNMDHQSLDPQPIVDAVGTKAEVVSTTTSSESLDIAGEDSSNKVDTDDKENPTAEGKKNFYQGGLQNTLGHERKIMELRFQGILLVNTLATFDIQWIGKNKKIVKSILMMWELPDRLERLSREETAELRYRAESKLLVECLQLYCRANPEDVTVLFRMLNVFSERSVIDYSFLKRFYFEEVAKTSSLSIKTKILKLFLTFINETKVPETIKVHALQLLVVPILTTVFADKNVRNTDLISTEILSLFVATMMHSHSTADASDELLVELIKVSTLLIEFMPEEMTDHRKNLIKFSWNHLKSKDLSCKNWSYINVCRFIAQYDTPPKIILQVYVALLRSHKPESKALVKKALDILVPALRKRLSLADFVKAIKWTKKVIFEDSHALPQVIHVWKVFVRNADMFYGHRELFMPQILQCLNRLALTGNPSLENRTLAIDLVEIILVWEIDKEKKSQDALLKVKHAEFRSAQRAAKLEAKLKLARKLSRIDAKRARKGKCALKDRKLSHTLWALTDERQPSRQRLNLRPVRRRSVMYRQKRSFSLQVGMSARGDKSITMVLNFLIRVTLSSAQVGQQDLLSRRCLDLLSRGLSIWPMTNIKVFSFRKLLESFTEDTSSRRDRRGSSPGRTSDDYYKSKSSSKAVSTKGGASKGKAQRSSTAVKAKAAAEEVAQQTTGTKPEVLLSCVGVLNEILRYSSPMRKNKFMAQNCQEIMMLLEPCIRTIAKIDYSEVDPKLLEVPNNLLTEPQRRMVTAIDDFSVKAPPTHPDNIIQLNKTFRTFLTRLVYVHPVNNPPKEFQDCRFYAYLKECLEKRVTAAVAARTRVIEQSLKGNSKDDSHVVSDEQPGRFRGYSALQCIAILCKAHTTTAQSYTSLLNKVLRILALDKTALNTSTKDSKGRSKRNSLSNEGVNEGVFSFKLSIQLTGVAIIRLSDKPDKREFLDILGHIIAKSDNTFAIDAVMDLVSKWVIHTFHPTPLQTKEKEAFLTKMESLMRFRDQHHALSVLTKYFDIIFKMCSAPENSRPEWLNMRLKKPFMSGLLSPNPMQRRAFFDLYVSQLEREGKLHSTHSRLLSILIQDWEPVSLRFWLPLASECLTSGRTWTRSVRLTTPGFPPFACQRFKSARPRGKAERRKNHAIANILAEDSDFFRRVSQNGSIQVKHLLHPLHELSHADSRVAMEVWTQLFPEAWKSLDDTAQVSLVKPLTTLLAQHYHRRQLRAGSGFGYRCNVVQGLLGGVARARPLPLIPAELISYLGKTYNTWHTAISICEQHVFNPVIGRNENNMICWTTALHTLYKELDERDHMHGLRHVFCKSRETTLALDLQANRQWLEAQRVLANAMSEHSSQSLSEFEFSGWKEDWVECCRQLGQWDMLTSYCSLSTEPVVLMECAWKSGDWIGLKKLFTTPAVRAMFEETLPDTRLLMYQICSAIQDWKHGEVEHLCRNSFQVFLQKWQSLPSITSSSHLRLLRSFQSLCELQESSKILQDLQSFRTNMGNSATLRFPDFTTYMHSWRERQPNLWEDATVWTDVFSWRLHMFEFVEDEWKRMKDRSGSTKVNSKFQDTPWTVLKLCEIAKSHKLHGLSLQCMDKVKDMNLVEVEIGFRKVAQQISLCLDEPQWLTNGLGIINKTNLKYLKPPQRGELFRLKGLFLERLGRVDEALSEFSKGMHTCDSYGDGWYSWAQFYDRLLYIATHGATDRIYRECAEHEVGAKPLEGLSLEYASNAMSSYLHAVHTVGSSSTRMMLARVLRLLQCGDSSGRLASVFASHVEETPTWCWIAWLPQLLSSLNRPEAPQVYTILVGLVNMFPQAVYYHLRTYLLERRDEQKKKRAREEDDKASGEEKDTVSPGGKKKEGVDYADELMRLLRRSHSSLVFEIELLLEELIVNFKPTLEEELLSKMQMIHSLVLSVDLGTRTMEETEPPLAVTAGLDRVHQRFFSAEVGVDPELDEFAARYGNLFASDFDMLRCPRISLAEVLRLLMKWKYILSNCLDSRLSRHDGTMQLEQRSPSMASYSSCAVEVPGQYRVDHEPLMEQHVFISAIETNYYAVQSFGHSKSRHCRLAIRASDGSLTEFLLQTVPPETTRSDTRVSQLFEQVNRLMSAHASCQNRSLQVVAPNIIPVTPRTRLLEQGRDFKTIAAIVDEYCAREGINAAEPTIVLKNAAVLPAPDFLIDEPFQKRLEQKRSAFQEICTTHIPSNILCDHVLQQLQTHERFWHARKEFTKHTAIVSYLSYLLSMGHQDPSKIALSLTSGVTMHAELRPTYNARGLIETGESVPFRLTQNMARFISGVGVQGPLANAMMAVSNVLKENEGFFEDFLFLLFKDDLAAQWPLVNVSMEEGMDVDTDEHADAFAFNTYVIKNVYRVLNRLEETTPILMPSPQDRSTCMATSRSMHGVHCMNTKIRSLLVEATDEANLCEMSVAWQPWV